MVLQAHREALEAPGGARLSPTVRALLIAGTVYGLIACSPDPAAPDPPVGGFQRLDLVAREAPGAPPEVRRVLTYEPGREPEAWTVYGGESYVSTYEGASLGGLPALVIEGEGNRRLEREVEVAADAFDSLELVLFTRSPLRVRAALLDGETSLVNLESDLVSGSDRPQRVVLPMPWPAPAAGRCDRLRLTLRGRRLPQVSFLSVELVERPPSTLPPPHGPAELVEAADQTRRGWWLSTRRSLSCEFDPGAARAVVFAFATPTAARRRGVGGELVVSLAPVAASDAAGGARLQRRLPLPGPEDEGGWRNVRLELPAGTPRSRLEFSLEAPGLERACTVAEVALEESPASDAPPPSVLLVTSDTHRADHIGLLQDGALLRTPALDALAARGVLFEDCFSPTNVTGGSHVSLLTGCSPLATGIVDNTTRLEDLAPTLAEAFAAAGFRTWAAISAVQLGPRVSGLGQGFDRVSAPLREPRGADLTSAVLLDWLGEEPDGPVFVWLHVYDGHHPYEPVGEYDRMYYDGPADPFDPELPDPGYPARVMPRALQGLRDLEYARAQYRAELTQQDDRLRPVLERPRFVRGVTAFVADHGEAFGEHGIYCDHVDLYPTTLHIPLVVAWPGAPAGTRASAPVQHLDLGRTLLDLAGLESAPFPGEDLRRVLPGLDGGSEELQREPRFALAANHTSAALTRDGWHLILHLRDHRGPTVLVERSRHSIELYDLNVDPGCARDRVAEQPARARELYVDLVRWLARPRTPGWIASVSDDPELLEGLAELGYVESGSQGEVLFETDDCKWCRLMARPGG